MSVEDHGTKRCYLCGKGSSPQKLVYFLLLCDCEEICKHGICKKCVRKSKKLASREKSILRERK